MGGFFSPGTPQAAVPQDLQGVRSQQIALLQQLLGLPSASPTAPPNQGLPLTAGMGGLPGFLGTQAFRQGRQPGPQVPGAPTPTQSPLDRLTQFFGQLGVPQTDLQRQSSGGISQFLNQPAPEQRALDVAMPGLQEILSGGGPQFERDLSLANQSGGRFGSANAILRGEALRNLYNQRTQAAQTLGMLSSNAGQNPFSRLLGASQVGGQEAAQGDVQTQRILQILMNLLGVAQQASFNVPTTQSPSPFSQLLGAAGGILPFIPGLGTAGALAAGGKTAGMVK